MTNHQQFLTLATPGSFWMNRDHVTGHSEWRRVKTIDSGVITFEVCNHKGAGIGRIRKLPTNCPSLEHAVVKYRGETVEIYCHEEDKEPCISYRRVEEKTK